MLSKEEILEELNEKTSEKAGQLLGELMGLGMVLQGIFDKYTFVYKLLKNGIKNKHTLSQKLNL